MSKLAPQSASKSAAVIGSPISHSLSPVIFRFLARHFGISNFSYQAEEVSAKNLKEYLIDLQSNEDALGVNVTLPHKTSILQYLDKISPDAAALGAVNLVCSHEDQLTGYNTDIIGIKKTLEKYTCAIHGQSVLVIGAGGAAAAAIYAVAQMGIKEIFVLNRTLAKAEALCRKMNGIFTNTPIIAIRNISLQKVPFSLIIQSTSIGMKNALSSPDESENYFSRLLGPINTTSEAAAFDLIYNPAHTLFLEWAKTRELKQIPGIDMLVFQALATWDKWFPNFSSVDVNTDELISVLRAHLDSRPIFLTGFMGSGKTTIGKILAETLGFEFLDTDALIEKECKKSISEVFRTDGEAFFRNKEAELMKRFSKTGRTVIALGGGSLLDPKNQEIVLQSGTVIYLEASMAFLQNNISKNTARPLLAEEPEANRLNKVTQYFESRRPGYERAHFRFAAEMPPESCAKKILEMIYAN